MCFRLGRHQICELRCVDSSRWLYKERTSCLHAQSDASFLRSRENDASKCEMHAALIGANKSQ
jgi:hypothetical protein